MNTPEISSVHSVKILLCYILDKLNRPVTEEQLLEISEDSEVISYFYFTDALNELIDNGSVNAEDITSADGSVTRRLTLTEKGRMGSEYFNRSIHVTFRKKLLRAAFSFFTKHDMESVCRVDVAENEGRSGCSVRFALSDGINQLLDMSFYAPDKEQAEYIARRIKGDPQNAYRKILGFLLENPDYEPDIEKYL